jgi:hypothetical protein
MPWRGWLEHSRCERGAPHDAARLAGGQPGGALSRARGAFVTVVLAQGVSNSFPVFLLPLSEDLGGRRSLSAAVFSAHNLVMGLVGTVVDPLSPAPARAGSAGMAPVGVRPAFRSDAGRARPHRRRADRGRLPRSELRRRAWGHHLRESRGVGHRTVARRRDLRRHRKLPAGVRGVDRGAVDRGGHVRGRRPEPASRPGRALWAAVRSARRASARLPPNGCRAPGAGDSPARIRGSWRGPSGRSRAWWRAAR